MMDYQLSLVSKCLNGERARDCQFCPAHHSKNGKCCFGIRYEHPDATCDPCLLNRECALSVRAQVQPQGSRGIIYPSRTVTNPQTQVRIGSPTRPVNRAETLRQYGPQPGEALLVNAPMEVVPLQLNPGDNLFVRFLKVSGWGCLEGFFEQAVNFVRRRRPE